MAQDAPWHYEMTHEKTIAAPPALVWRALAEVCVADLPAARLLFWLRGLPARLSGRPAFVSSETVPLLEGMVHSRFSLLTFDEPRLVEIARIARFWESTPTSGPIMPDHEAFAAFAEPGFAKAIMSIELLPQGAGTRVVTATRIRATDEEARRKFGRYWSVIRVGSSTIRRAMLSAAEHRAMALAAGEA